MGYAECYDIVKMKLKINGIKNTFFEGIEMKNNLVLLVDDNPNNIQVLASIIADIGIAQSANETYQFLKGNAPNLILLDVEMPDIDGYEHESQSKIQRYSDHFFNSQK